MVRDTSVEAEEEALLFHYLDLYNKANRMNHWFLEEMVPQFNALVKIVEIRDTCH